MFFGTYTPKLDEKGRLILPAKFRDQLAGGLMVTRGQEHCLYVWPQEEINRITERLREAPVSNKATRDYVRMFSSASSDTLQKPAAPAGSVLSRARPVPPRDGDVQRFAAKSAPKVAGKTTKQARRTALPKSQSTTEMVVKVPQRKSSLDVRAEAELHRRAEEALLVVHPNSVSRDVELERRFYSSASAYLPGPLEDSREGKRGEKDMCASAAAAARVRRGRVVEEGSMTKSFSLPVLFTARTPAQRAAGDNGTGRGHGRRKSVVSTGPGDDEGRVEPPLSGVLVVREKVTSTVGLAL